MKLQEMNISSITPYEKNNKIHDDDQLTKIENSIKEFWFQQPIVTDKNWVIIAGHWRYEAAKRLWLDKVPVIVADKLTPEQVKKYRILDNKLNESDWNIENLKIEIEELPNFNIGELEIWKYDLFPMLETEEFDIWDYEVGEWSWWQTWNTIVKVFVPYEQVDELKEYLTAGWYTDFK